LPTQKTQKKRLFFAQNGTLDALSGACPGPKNVHGGAEPFFEGDQTKPSTHSRLGPPLPVLRSAEGSVARGVRWPALSRRSVSRLDAFAARAKTAGAVGPSPTKPRPVGRTQRRPGNGGSVLTSMSNAPTGTARAKRTRRGEPDAEGRVGGTQPGLCPWAGSVFVSTSYGGALGVRKRPGERTFAAAAAGGGSVTSGAGNGGHARC